MENPFNLFTRYPDTTTLLLMEKPIYRWGFYGGLKSYERYPPVFLAGIDTVHMIYFLSGLTSLKNKFDSRLITLFPNPASNSLHIDWKGKQPIYFRINDLMGKTIVDQQKLAPRQQ
jgi:hypothetical protein